MKKLSKFLSLALTSASLLLPSASALRDISRSDAEQFITGGLSTDYAEQAYVEYVYFTKNKNSDRLKTLKLKIANDLEMLKEENPRSAVNLTMALISEFKKAHAHAHVYDRYDYDCDDCLITRIPKDSSDDFKLSLVLIRRGYLSSGVVIE